MHKTAQSLATSRPAGYAALIDRYELTTIPSWHQSAVATQGTGHRTRTIDDRTEETYPAKYWPGETAGDHLEFALKYDGTDLGILASVFDTIDPSEIQQFIESKPTGKYTRRIWYLYELLTGRALQLDDLTQGTYVPVLEPSAYYTLERGHRVKRQRVMDNLLGDARFCPTVRRTEALRRFEQADLPSRCAEAVAEHPPELLRRALDYLYTKETRSSFAIEREEPTSARTERFVAMLKSAERDDFGTRERLLELQNRIVDARFQDSDYRTTQNYVGETIGMTRERVHYVSPDPADLPDLMGGLLAAHERMESGAVEAVVHATVLAYGFVFLHPFEDGNGRIHRFLIHNVLARRDFTPQGIMFPVSAAMLHDEAAYDASLEAFSRPLMQLVDYTLDPDGRMTVTNDVRRWYRFIDLTHQAEALFRFIERTVDTELPDELLFLARYDEARHAARAIVDLPDRLMDLFIRLVLQNRGRLSARKRAGHFAMLTDREVERLEGAIREAYDVDEPTA